MAGISKSRVTGDILYLQMRTGDQQLFCLAYAVCGQVLISRAVEEPAEQTCQILWCDKYLSAQICHSQRQRKVSFNFFYYGKNVILIKRCIGRTARVCSVCNIYQNGIAVDREQLPVNRVGAVQRNAVIDQAGDLRALPGAYGNNLTVSHDLRDTPLGRAGKSSEFYSPDIVGLVVRMAYKRGDQKPLVLPKGICTGSCLYLTGALFCLQ